MKLINRFYILAILVSFFSCEEEDYEPISHFSDVAYVVNQNSQELILEQGQSLSFMDLSQGTLSHKWIIENENNFLKPGFEKNDSLPLFINPELDTICTNPTAHVLFNNYGMQKVRLYNTYSESVRLNEENGQEAVEIDGVWVFDHTIDVNVFGPIKPALNVYKGEELVYSLKENDIIPENTEEWDTVSVEFGEELRFVDMTTVDRPDFRLWSFDKDLKIGSSEDSVFTARYEKMGEYIGTTFTTGRENTHYPLESVKIAVPLKVTVKPSSIPFTIDGEIKIASNNQLRIFTNGAIETIDNEEANFVVHVANENGFDSTIEVKKASVSSATPTVINLILKQDIYDNDVIMVSYTKGNITSTDGRTLSSFDPTMVSQNNANELDSNLFGFEIASDNYKEGFAEGWWVASKNDNFARTEEKAFAGVASMRYTSLGEIVDKTIKCSSFPSEDPDDFIPAGKYRVSISVFKETGTTLNLFQTTTKTPDPYLAINWDISSIETGKWVTLTQEIDMESDLTEAYSIVIKKKLNDVTEGDQTIYFDALSFVRNNTRP